MIDKAKDSLKDVVETITIPADDKVVIPNGETKTMAEKPRGRLPGFLAFNMGSFIEAIARKELDLPIEPAEKDLPHYYKEDKKADREEGKHRVAIDSLTARIKKSVDEEDDNAEKWLEMGQEIFADELKKACAPPPVGGSSKAALLQAQLDDERKERLAAAKEVEELKKQIAKLKASKK